jgi:hypothetical protein
VVFSLTVLSILEVVTNIVKVLLLVKHVDEVLRYKPEGHIQFSMGTFQILHEFNTSGSIMVLGYSLPVGEMSISSLSWGVQMVAV